MSRGGRRLKWGSEPTTTTNLDGIWGLNEINNLIGQTKWPRGPVAPTSLTTTVGVAQLSLSWTAPSTTYGTITNYLVEYTASGGSVQYVLTNSTSTSYTLTGLTNGTAYTVRVAAVNFTAGDYSSAITGTPSTATVPGIVQNLSAFSSNVDTVSASWSAPSQNGGSPITQYKVVLSGSCNRNGTYYTANTYLYVGNQTSNWPCDAYFTVRAMNIIGEGALQSAYVRKGYEN